MLPIDSKSTHRFVHPSEKLKEGEAVAEGTPKPTVWVMAPLTARQRALLDDLKYSVPTSDAVDIASGGGGEGNFSLKQGSIALIWVKLALVGVEHFGSEVVNRSKGTYGLEAPDEFLDLIPPNVLDWLATKAQALGTVSVAQAKPS